MKYFLEDIKWFYTLDGSFAMPYILSKSKTKIKNLISGTIIDISDGLYGSVKRIYELDNYNDSNIKCEGSDVDIIAKDSKLRGLLPPYVRLKYFTGNKYNNMDRIKAIKGIKVSEVQIAIACENLKYKLYREYIKNKRQIARHNKNMELINKIEKAKRDVEIENERKKEAERLALEKKKE
jgi:hypothetical protein